jgi:uncharacterized membrane protein
MNRSLLIVVRWLQTFCLAVWIGGIVVIGGVVAPVAFRHAGLETAEAGRVVTGSLDRLNDLLLVAGFLLLVFQFVEIRSRAGPVFYASLKRAATLRFLMTFIGLFLVAYLEYSLLPNTLRSQQAGLQKEFQAGHRLYGLLTMIHLGLALGVAWINASFSVQTAANSSFEESETELPSPASKHL